MGGPSPSSSSIIQSLSIPSHAQVSSPAPPHVVYNILIQTPTSSYTIPHRYSSFVNLHQSLTDQVGAPPPVTLPPKRVGHLFSLSTSLSASQLVQRRLDLEQYLRSLLSHKDPRWSSSPSFLQFLAAPPLPESTSTHFTSSTWLQEYSTLLSLAQSLRAQFLTRDHQILSPSSSSSSHSTHLSAQKSLVSLVHRLSLLTISLEALAREGMPQGELNRRREMVASLQGEVEELGRRGGEEKPKIGGSAAPTRVLGAAPPPPPPQETSETRPLDNQGLLTLQQTYVHSQDERLESLTSSIRRQRALGELINQELEVQGEVLGRLEEGTDRVGKRLGEAGRGLRKLG